MKKLSLGACLSIVFLLISSLLSAEVLERHNATNVSIKDYVLVNSWYDANELNRSLALEIQNTGSAVLYDVKATLIHASSDVVINEGVVFFGTVVPGQAIISSEFFECAVNTSKVPDGKMQYTWQIEYSDGNGNDFTDEALVEEVFNYKLSNLCQKKLSC